MSGNSINGWKMETTFPSTTGTIAIKDSDGIIIAIVIGDATDPIVQAKARLFFAAPRMLDLIERLFQDHQRMYPHHAHLCDDCKEASRIMIELGRGDELPDYLRDLASEIKA